MKKKHLTIFLFSLMILLVSSSFSYSYVYDNLSGSSLGTDVWTERIWGSQFINYSADSFTIGFDSFTTNSAWASLDSNIHFDDLDIIVSWSNLNPVNLESGYRYHLGMAIVDWDGGGSIFQDYTMGLDFFYNESTNTINTVYGSGYYTDLDPTAYSGEYKWQFTTDTEGYFRIKREGSELTSYYYSETDGWIILNTLSPEDFGSTNINLYASYESIGGDSPSISFSGQFNNTLSNPVPEPATMLLFGTGLIGLAGVRRRGK